jgi:hypothetical protein
VLLLARDRALRDARILERIRATQQQEHFTDHVVTRAAGGPQESIATAIRLVIRVRACNQLRTIHLPNTKSRPRGAACQALRGLPLTYGGRAHTRG